MTRAYAHKVVDPMLPRKAPSDFPMGLLLSGQNWENLPKGHDVMYETVKQYRDIVTREATALVVAFQR